MTVTVPLLSTPVADPSNTVTFAARAAANFLEVNPVFTAANLQNIENNTLNADLNAKYSAAIAAGLTDADSNAASAAISAASAGNSAATAAASATTASAQSTAATSSATAANIALLALGSVLANGVGAMSVNADGELVASWNEPTVTSMVISASGDLTVTYP